MSIHPTAVIDKKAELGTDVEVGAFTIIEGRTVVGDNTCIANNVTVKQYSTIGNSCEIHTGAVIGGVPQDLKYAGEESQLLIGDRNTIREYVTIHRGTQLGGGKTVIGDDNLIMIYCHIAHDCILGNQIIMSGYSGLAGHVHIQDGAILAGYAAVHQFATIGRLAFVAGCSSVSRDVPPYMLVEGNPTKVRGINIIGIKRNNISREAIIALKVAQRGIFRSDKSITQSISDLQGSPEMDVPEVQELCGFLNTSEKGPQGRALETGRSGE